MDNLEFYERILDLGEGWKITEITINKAVHEVEIYAEYVLEEGLFPGTNERSKIYDLRPMRRWRHLNTLQYKTFINARIPRVKNSKGDIRTIEISWADKRVGYTFLFESLVIETLKISKNQTKTAEYLEILFDTVHSIMERAVKRGMNRRRILNIKALSVDEKSYKYGHNYMTVLSDPIDKKVLDIIEGRTEEATQEIISMTLSPEQMKEILFVTMDMWRSYMNAVKELMPQADILHDKFHTMQYLNKAVDEVRKREVKSEEVLKKTKYIFLKNKESWSPGQELKFEEIDRINLNTSKAWHMKENFKGIFFQETKYKCFEFFKEWLVDVLKSNLKPMIKAGETLLRHFDGIANYSIHYCTNAIAEELNAQIQVLKVVGRGFRNFSNYRNSILFFFARLDLLPLKNL